MKPLLTAISVAALFATASIAMAASTPAKDPAFKVHGSIVCPVSGETLASPKDAFNSEVYKGKTYYFCCAGCKPLFDKDPQKYIKAAAGGKHSSMGM
jgi:YHS domain-containing protein